MKSRLIGAKFLDFVDDSGRPVKGLKLILTCPDPDWAGTSVTLPFINAQSELYSKLANNLRDYINQNVNVDYMPSSGGKLKVVDIALMKQ